MANKINNSPLIIKLLSNLLFLKFLLLSLLLLNLGWSSNLNAEELKACVKMAADRLLPIADDRSKRFLGKVEKNTALCRGGEQAEKHRAEPWVDWSNYWASGDSTTLHEGSEAITKLGEHLKPNGRGIDGALMDLEYQRLELIKFNLFDNYTYETYVKGQNGKSGAGVKQWDEMRLSRDHDSYEDVGGESQQVCQGELIRYRTLDGICNDLINPLMGSTGTVFPRNAEFEATFPHLGKTELILARHSDPVSGFRLAMMKPDPQLISRKLFTRPQNSGTCNEGKGLPNDSLEAECDYQKAPFFNVLAAFWIQFMTHDWFSHLDEGSNQSDLKSAGCLSVQASELGCRPGDVMQTSLYAEDSEPETFMAGDASKLKRAHRTTRNNVTAWWDASQIYGYDDISKKRVLHDPDDNARLLQPEGYLPLFDDCTPACPVQPQWQGQEATAFPDNWNIGLSFYHNLFVREHNQFVDRFRQLQKNMPQADSGLRNPQQPDRLITYADVTDEEIYQAARLVVSAMIAKIHTIEWTTQLLYGEPLYKGMNSNWFGLFNLEPSRVSLALQKILKRDEGWLSRLSAKFSGELAEDSDDDRDNAIYSVLASGAGIFGLNNSRMEGALWWKHDAWDITNIKDVNGGINHFGSPFNFPEEFPSVYRLHPLLPDLIEYREKDQPNIIKHKISLLNTVRGDASAQIKRGIENWALSMGRQRLGLLHLQNHPQFLQNLEMAHLAPGNKLDIAALDVIRDRERGVPRFNEFRRQIGLKTLTSYDDFVDKRLPENSPARLQQRQVVENIREVYGTHVCDASKVISRVQRMENGEFINDCLGHADKSVVDNIEDVDNVVGWLAEYTRPHGFAISETQFHIFIINASRRLFSDRFFTSSFRPEFYSTLGYDWVLNNGPLDDCPYMLKQKKNNALVCNEPEKSNSHEIAVSPLKRVLMRNLPALRDELLHVVNAFDPWARDRGEYYSLQWQARSDAKDDPAFTIAK